MSVLQMLNPLIRRTSRRQQSMLTLFTTYDDNFGSDGDSNKGVVSFYDVAYASSVLQKTNQATDDWKRDGYSCYPEPPYDNTYNLNYNVSECALAVLPPSSETVQIVLIDLGYDYYATYHPFGLGNRAYPTIIFCHLGLAKDRLRVQAPPEDHFARYEHGLEF